MKRLLLITVLVSALVSCSAKKQIEKAISHGNYDHAISEALRKLENNKDSLITISSNTGVLKTITINEDGSFKDTLVIPKANIYTFQTSNVKRAPIFLKNGFDIHISGDADKFMKSFKYSGEGAQNSNYVLAQIEMSQSIGDPKLILSLDKKSFDRRVKEIKNEYDSIVKSYNNLDSILAADALKQSEQIANYFNTAYAENAKFSKGNPSPKFVDYVDIKGGKKSLDSFKGKYVYIDVWATWCGPCIQQIPFLQSLEKEYAKKNIEFVSISTDESRRSGGSWEAAEKKWRDFVKEKQMTGVQLWSGQDFSFQQAYQIAGIPRFILIDPNGNIVDANAPRPSDPRLKTLLNSLL